MDYARIALVRQLGYAERQLKEIQERKQEYVEQMKAEEESISRYVDEIKEIKEALKKLEK